MNRRTFTVDFFEDSVQLRVWDRYGGILKYLYPQTFTVEECLEDWCVEHNYGFVNHIVNDFFVTHETGTFDFVISALGVRG